MLISTYTFDSYFSCFNSNKKYRILVDKKVPSTITSEDFYFDKDVAILDQVISGKDIQFTDVRLFLLDFEIINKYLIPYYLCSLLTF